MTFSDIMQLISNQLFPIAACVGMAWYFNQVNNNYRTDIKELQKIQKAEILKLTEAVNNNTTVMRRLENKLSK